MRLIMSDDLERYSGIWNDLENSSIIGTDNYHKTTTTAYNVLFFYKKLAPLYQVHTPPAAFTSLKIVDTKKNKKTPGNDGISFPEVTCCR